MVFLFQETLLTVQRNSLERRSLQKQGTNLNRHQEHPLLLKLALRRSQLQHWKRNLRNKQKNKYKSIQVKTQILSLKIWLTRHYESSLPQQQRTFRLEQQSTPGRMNSSSSLLSLPWFKLAKSVEKVMKMQVHTYNTFQRSATPSQSEEYQKMLSYSVFSHSHYWGKQTSGSTSTKTNTIHGTYARLLSQQNSFLQPRPMLYVGR